MLGNPSRCAVARIRIVESTGLGGFMNVQSGACDPRFRHAATWSSPNREITDTILSFVNSGIDAGEPVLVSCSGPLLAGLRRQLTPHGDLLQWAGLESAQVNPHRITAAMRAFADDHPGQPVRFLQEPAWHLLGPDHLCEAIRHEALVNLVLAEAPATVLCAYDWRLSGQALGSAQQTHPMTLREGRWQPSELFGADAAIPPECDKPLPGPPPDAPALTYRNDQAGVREFTAGQARVAGLPADSATDLMIAVGELAANTLAHTDGPGTLWIWAAGNDIFCQVRDGGQIQDPLVGSFLPGPEAAVGGRGLWVVHQLCDLAEIRSGPGGTTIRVRMSLGAGPVAPPLGRRAAAGCHA